MINICAVICSYNGIEFLPGCIDSLKRQTYNDIEICVVDNGSTDGTSQYIIDRYGKDVIIIRNDRNLGGAGGFETGIQYALKQGFQYIALLDNDIVLAEDTIERLYNRLCNDKGLGIVGARVMSMDEPEKMMWFGFNIDFTSFTLGISHNFSEQLPDEVDCDYIPACMALTTGAVLKECGTMPVENFIYHDDIEMCTNIKRNGYQVIALRDALVWHKGGGGKKRGITTFGRYYSLRNKWKFFSKFIDENDLDRYMDIVMDEVFEIIYASHRKDADAIFYTTMFAFDDFLHGFFGKAGAGRIREIEGQKYNKIKKAVEGHQRVAILASPLTKGYERALSRLKNQILRFNKNIMIDDTIQEEKNGEEYDVIFVLCEHVTKIKKNILPQIFFDEWLNVVVDESDYLYFSEFDNAKELFKRLHRPLFKERIGLIRKNMNTI